MTKLIALIAVLAALAWAVTATASWITARKAPRMLGRGTTPLPSTKVEENRAFLLAQLRTVLAVVFTVAIFAAIFRFSVGISGQAGLTAVLTAQLSISAGLLLFSALPAKRRSPEGAAEETGKRSLAVGAVILLAFAAFVATAGTLAPEYLPWQEGVPALLAATALAGSALLAGRRISSMSWFQDPRMAALDQKWRRLSLQDLAGFTHGALLAGLGGTALLARLTMDPAQATGVWTAAGAAGAALLAAGVVLMGITVKGTLQLRARVRTDTAAQRVSA